MSWAKTVGGSTLSHDVGTPLPNEFWVQDEVWIPAETFTACGGDGMFTSLATFIFFGYDGLFAENFGTELAPDWRWCSDSAGVAATGPTPSTAYTIEAHFVKISTSSANVEWYVNGTLILTSTVSTNAPHQTLILSRFPGACCCEVYYYTNVSIGTTRHGTEIFSDGFSGGLGNWSVDATVAPSAASVVAATSSAPCPTLSVSPPRGQAGTPITITGAGFPAGAAITLSWNGIVIEGVAGVADGSGNVTILAVVPQGFGVGSWPLYLADDQGNVACSASEFSICGPVAADGISRDYDPLVATGGGPNFGNPVLDYIFHDGAHWVLWADPSVSGSGGQGSVFPPPANHTLNATRISADSSSVTDYPIDTGYRWNFTSPTNAFSFLGQKSTICCNEPHPTESLWDRVFWFDSWEKPILDAKFGSDQSNLWVAVLTRETIPYPWVSMSPVLDIPSVTSGYTVFQTTRPAHDPGSTFDPIIRLQVGTLDFCHDTLYPVSDGGDTSSGNWDPPVIAMFSFDGSAFNRIGNMDAKYCPGRHDAAPGSCEATDQIAPRGSFFSKISIAAHPSEPGICHIVWSEGGDWGSYGLATSDACGCPKPLIWDGGPANRDYRVGHSVWSPTAKLSETDLFHSHVNRGDWNFIYDGSATGFSWPDQADFSATVGHDVRNDQGSPLLFLAWQNSIAGFEDRPPDSAGNPWIDNFLALSEPTLRVYDISGGTPLLLQQIEPDLLPTEAEVEELFPAVAGPLASNALDGGGLVASSVLADEPRPFGVSLPYADPLLADQTVYLVHVPWVNLSIDRLRAGDVYAFYRIKADMSDTFEFLDGDRQLRFTIIKNPPPGGGGAFVGTSFFSDPNNIWLPADIDPLISGGQHYYDRICANEWVPLLPVLFPGTFPPPIDISPLCPGFYYDPASDSISYCTADWTGDGNYFGVVTLYICRSCQPCRCSMGIHIAHRF